MSISEILKKYPPIRGADEGSFAGFTIRERLPMILDRIIQDNDFPRRSLRKLIKLKEEIVTGNVGDLITSGEDAALWNEWIKPYVGFSWFELPFYGTEAYFYRLVLDYTGFFDNGIDPFFKQKEHDVCSSHDHFIGLINSFESFRHNSPDKNSLIKYLLLNSLWGNKADLSQVHIEFRANNDISKNETLIDHSEIFVREINQGVNRIDIILDNCGLELFADLMLAEGLISTGLVKNITLHAKYFPMFVSDATSIDVHFLIEHLSSLEDPVVLSYLKKVGSLIAANRIQIVDHLFWNSPASFYEIPNDLTRELRRSDLIIIKGDANYRRVFGDRTIPVDTNPQLLANYLPARSIAIRILKSEILLGLNKNISSSLKLKDKDWLVNGKYGIIQKLN